MRNTLQTLVRNPYVLGADWFQYHDEPRHGRDDGENFNFGLVDIGDRPYAEVTSATVALDWTRLKAGDTFEFSSTLHSHGRAYRVEWTGRFTLADTAKP